MPENEETHKKLIQHARSRGPDSNLEQLNILSTKQEC
jgi:hypothetical protein